MNYYGDNTPTSDTTVYNNNTVYTEKDEARKQEQIEETMRERGWDRRRARRYHERSNKCRSMK